MKKCVFYSKGYVMNPATEFVVLIAANIYITRSLLSVVAIVMKLLEDDQSGSQEAADQKI
jgi:hypothetical protein